MCGIWMIFCNFAQIFFANKQYLSLTINKVLKDEEIRGVMRRIVCGNGFHEL